MKTAAFFEVGDIILYGKYKNKKGRIVRFGDDGKGNPTVEIEPIPKGRKQNKTLGLFKIWKQKDMKSAERVAVRYLEASMADRVAARSKEAEKVTREKGTCGFCGKVQKVPNKLLANHGYQRPGYGYIQGQCMGSRHAPWEVSPVTGEMARDFFQTRANSLESQLRRIDQADEITIPGGSWSKPRTINKAEVDEVLWNRYYADYKKRTESEAKAARKDYEHFKKLVDEWKATEVIVVDERKEERVKREKRDEVRNKRMERYEGLKKKALERLDRTWNNLKQRESKAKSKPTAKNYIAVGKAANILYEIYGGTSSKLAEAHPDPGYRNIDVLKEFDRDQVWRHIGTMKGSTYLNPQKDKDIKEYASHAYSGSLGWGMHFPSLSDHSKEPDVSRDWRPNWPGFRG